LGKLECVGLETKEHLHDPLFVCLDDGLVLDSLEIGDQVNIVVHSLPPLDLHYLVN
jgi:hypothetical protein